MRIENLILFSDTLRKLINHSSIVFTVFFRAVRILLKWRKLLSVDILQVNESFLLSNGLLLIKWQLKNFLWVKINNEILSVSPKGVLLHYNKLRTPVKIKIVGLFGRYEEEFLIVPTATLESKNLQAPTISNTKFKQKGVNASINKLAPLSFQPVLLNPSLTKALATKISIAHIQIPTFKKENYHA